MSRFGRAFLWVLPYLGGGFSAPFIFRAAPTLQMGGRYAGALFISAGLWSLWLARLHSYARPIQIFLYLVFLLELIFWSWRFFNSQPMKEATLLGFSGTQWHMILTSLYLVVVCVLSFCEVKRTQ